MDLTWTRTLSSEGGEGAGEGLPTSLSVHPNMAAYLSSSALFIAFGWVRAVPPSSAAGGLGPGKGKGRVPLDHWEGSADTAWAKSRVRAALSRCRAACPFSPSSFVPPSSLWRFPCPSSCSSCHPTAFFFLVRMSPSCSGDWNMSFGPKLLAAAVGPMMTWLIRLSVSGGDSTVQSTLTLPIFSVRTSHMTMAPWSLQDTTFPQARSGHTDSTLDPPCPCPCP